MSLRLQRTYGLMHEPRSTGYAQFSPFLYRVVLFPHRVTSTNCVMNCYAQLVVVALEKQLENFTGASMTMRCEEMAL
jgi:hypothetical protein